MTDFHFTTQKLNTVDSSNANFIDGLEITESFNKTTDEITRLDKKVTNLMVLDSTSDMNILAENSENSNITGVHFCVSDILNIDKNVIFLRSISFKNNSSLSSDNTDLLVFAKVFKIFFDYKHNTKVLEYIGRSENSVLINTLDDNSEFLFNDSIRLINNKHVEYCIGFFTDELTPVSCPFATISVNNINNLASTQISKNFATTDTALMSPLTKSGTNQIAVITDIQLYRYIDTDRLDSYIEAKLEEFAHKYGLTSIILD